VTLCRLATLKKIVEKAVKAAITVITQEFHQKVQDLKDYVKHLEDRIDKLESAESPQSDVSDLTRKIDAVARENRQYAAAANEAEQFSRKNNIRIKGLTVISSRTGKIRRTHNWLRISRTRSRQTCSS